MRNALIVCAAFAICGAAMGEPDSTPAKPATEPALQPAPSATPRAMTVTTIALADDTVCRREAPTGSRIMTKRCYSRVQEQTAAAAANDRLQQEQLDELRRLQLYRQQERALARSEALQRAMQR
jgi:hypothetical protein